MNTKSAQLEINKRIFLIKKTSRTMAKTMNQLTGSCWLLWISKPWLFHSHVTWGSGVDLGVSVLCASVSWAVRWRWVSAFWVTLRTEWVVPHQVLSRQEVLLGLLMLTLSQVQCRDHPVGCWVPDGPWQVWCAPGVSEGGWGRDCNLGLVRGSLGSHAGGQAPALQWSH